MVEPSWLGRRVSVRRVTDHDHGGTPRFGDVVGDLVGLDGTRAVVETRSGLVEVPLGLVTAAKLVPPSTRDELDLEAVVARGWRPEETAQVGGWLLRASAGFTARGNSVLPLGSPGVLVDEALARAADWYGRRGLPLQLQVPVEARRLLDADLGERGWPADRHTSVLTARLDMLVPAAPSFPVTLTDAPSDGWLAVFRGGAALASAHARALLTRHEQVTFAAVRSDGGDVLAVGRGTVDDAWLGVTAVEVVPTQRRRGLARAIMAALWDWGRARGARRTHLEVESENAPALALYRELEYRPHHDYHYRRATPP